MSFPGGSVVKNLPASGVDAGLIPGSGRSPGEGNGNPLQYSCLKNSMDRGAWWATVHGVTKMTEQRSAHGTYSLKEEKISLLLLELSTILLTRPYDHRSWGMRCKSVVGLLPLNSIFFSSSKLKVQFFQMDIQQSYKSCY